ncbi:MAG: peptide-methionine (R)-S-oxide reductase MsrB [Nanoarchaeota archaeon]
MKKEIKTDAEWKKILTPEQYNILRKKGTEPSNSCGLLRNKEKGVYSCVACGNKLFKSSEKFESRTGWPSFFEPYSKDALEYKEDSSLFDKRTEVLCAKCGGHLGHVFPDGPPPTFKRYCINGTVLKFEKI